MLGDNFRNHCHNGAENRRTNLQSRQIKLPNKLERKLVVRRLLIVRLVLCGTHLRNAKQINERLLLLQHFLQFLLHYFAQSQLLEKRIS